jgi:hypothetical protein
MPKPCQLVKGICIHSVPTWALERCCDTWFHTHTSFAHPRTEFKSCSNKLVYEHSSLPRKRWKGRKENVQLATKARRKNTFTSPSTFAHSLTQMISFQPRGSLPQVSAAKGLHRSTARSPCANSPAKRRTKKKVQWSCKKRDSVRSTLRLVICCCDFLPLHFTAGQVQTANTSPKWRIMYRIGAPAVLTIRVQFVRALVTRFGVPVQIANDATPGGLCRGD